MSVKIEQKDTSYEYQANFSEACKTCRDFLRIHDGTTEMDVESLIAIPIFLRALPQMLQNRLQDVSS